MTELTATEETGPDGRAERSARWSAAGIAALFELPFNDLLHRAQQVHREHFDPNKVQVSQLLSIKTGGCPEDCAYCPQSAHFETEVGGGKLLAVDEVVAAAAEARAGGATRFCMGAAWRGPGEHDLAPVLDMVRGVKALGMETCATLGLLTAEQAAALKAAGLDYYNHNIDTSPEFYGEIITTRNFADRLETLDHVRRAGMSVCCGGILGMGEGRADRVAMLEVLANMEPPPESVPINMLVPVEGTPLEGREPLDGFEFVRTIAAARILMPESHVRLSAGREAMTDELQALAFHAGANSIFVGEELLTTANPGRDRDRDLFARLGLEPEPPGG